MLKTTTLVVCSLALTFPVLVWQAVSAESVNGFSPIRVPVDGMDNESSSLLMIGVILIGASFLASRVIPPKPSLQSDTLTSVPSHGAARTPSL